MSGYRRIGRNLYNTDGSLYGYVDLNGNEQPNAGGASAFAALTGNPTDNAALSTALSNAGSPTTAASLSADKTLAAGDDNKIFTATSASTWVVTVPAGLTGFNLAAFVPPGVGSVTLRPASGVTLNGAAVDIVVNTTNAAAGVTLQSLGSNAYGVAGLSASDATGFATTSALLLAGFHLPLDAKIAANKTLAPTDNGKIFWGNAAGSFAVRIPAGLGKNFSCIVGCAGAGGLVLTPLTGVSIGGTFGAGTSNIAANAFKTIPQGALALVVCDGTGDAVTDVYNVLSIGSAAMTA